MDANPRRRTRDSLLVALASARTDLVEILTDTLRKLLAARSGFSIASMAGLNPDASYEVGDGGPPMSPAQLSDLIEKFETEEAQIRELLARIDERLGEVSPLMSGAVH